METEDANAHPNHVYNNRLKLDTILRRDAKYPPQAPSEPCLATFLGLTVQPRGEPCGSASRFDFLTVEVIQIKKKTPLLKFMNLYQWLVARSIPEEFRLRIF
jgi:hypothetical protein